MTERARAPRVARWIERFIAPVFDVDAVLGDLQEEFCRLSTVRGRLFARLQFAVELLLIVWQAAAGRARHRVHRLMNYEGIDMNAATRSWKMSIVVNIGLLAGFWLLGFALVQLGQRAQTWVISQAGLIVAAVLALVLAFKLRAMAILYFLAVTLSFATSEFIMHSLYGIRSVQGGPTHYAVWLAAIFGVSAGHYLARRSDPSRGAMPPQQTSLTA